MRKKYEIKEFLFDMNIVLYHWFQEQDEETRKSVIGILLDTPSILELFTVYPYQIVDPRKENPNEPD